MPKFNILRSQRALSAIGSGLVLITYVVHDGFRESLKDLVSSMQNAENVYLSRATVLAVLREYAAGNDASGETPFKHAKYFWTSFEASRDLIDHLPQADQTRFRAGLERLTKEFTHAAAESGALALDHLINQGAKKGNSSNLGKLTNKTEFDLLGLTFGLDEDMDRFQSDLLTRVRAVRDSSQNRYKVLTGTSYATYFLGWLLAFVGIMRKRTDP